MKPGGIQVASVGDTVELKCSVKANPKPKMLFWRDHDGRVPVIQGANFDMTMMDDDNVSFCTITDCKRNLNLKISIIATFLHLGSRYLHHVSQNQQNDITRRW